MLAGLLPASAGAEPQVPAGIWMKPGGKAAVELFACEGGKLCGRLMWARKSVYPEGQTRDINNPDPDLRSRELCGAVILWGLEWDGPDTWEDGWVYDPSTGSTYNARIVIEGPETLNVRGYKYVTLLGKTQTWAPAPDDLDLCTQPMTAEAR